MVVYLERVKRTPHNTFVCKVGTVQDDIRVSMSLWIYINFDYQQTGPEHFLSLHFLVLHEAKFPNVTRSVFLMVCVRVCVCVCVCVQVRDSAQSFLTVQVPLYVSYIYVTAPRGWASLEHHTEMEFSFFYDTVLWRTGKERQGQTHRRTH